jgi:tetratricopeptide (TPR) repeat protein
LEDQNNQLLDKFLSGNKPADSLMNVISFAQELSKSSEEIEVQVLLALQQGNINEAISLYDNFRSKDKEYRENVVNTYVKMGELKVLKFDYEGAAADYEKAWRDKPDEYDYFELARQYYLKINKLDSGLSLILAAKAHFKKGTREYFNIRINEAFVHVEQRDYQKAVDLLADLEPLVIDADEETQFHFYEISGKAYVRLADDHKDMKLIMLALEKYHQAEKIYQATQIYQDNAFSLFNGGVALDLANTYGSLGHWEQSNRYYQHELERVMRIYPLEHDLVAGVLYNMGLNYAQQNIYAGH